MVISLDEENVRRPEQAKYFVGFGRYLSNIMVGPR